MKRFEDDFGRWYELDGKLLMSVTTITRKGSPLTESKADYLMYTTKEKAEFHLKNAGQFGTEAHEYFEAYLKGEEVVPKPSHQPHVEKFKEWVKAHNVRHTHLEERLYSKRFGFAGTCDFIGYFTTCDNKSCCRQQLGEKLVIADWKTSVEFDITFGWQIAAYREAAIEMGLVDKSAGIVGVHIPRTGGSIKTFTYEHYDFCFEMFLHCLGMVKGRYFNYLNKMKWEYLKEKALIINGGCNETT